MGRFGLAAALMTTALFPGCQPQPVPCPAIAMAPVVTVTIAASYVPAVASLHLKACQDGACEEEDLELMPGYVSIDQGCRPDGMCSATSSPDGTRVGHLFLPNLSESPIDATASGTGPDGNPLPTRTITFTPKANYPYGEQCGKFITASLELDAAGLRQR
ncbi:hypothetical protein [Arthrobacter cavernae]|uniref:Uncharacterized protein n=1 Tax=Arthrobacter cavernae TaxID=2817681 RepID=A0A939HL19_9MICC|nr:hypothetical protein [Arthrobacter cavernae]MBO1269756.1 hypothetical protein [Arthrobacter cavernae]